MSSGASGTFSITTKKLQSLLIGAVRHLKGVADNWCREVTAPSQVSEVIKEKVQQRSIQLSWQEPQQPNGVITEYEIKYYEKVSHPETSS
ncbi:hypothetical protein LDENG_00233770 [Lucifuga dentata]|nr:hypothetical protein LDENG_00233770 [Lucifuga dentata]